MRFGLLQPRVALLLIDWRGIVEEDNLRRVTISPEVLVVRFDGVTHVAEPIGRSHEIDVSVATRQLSNPLNGTASHEVSEQEYFRDRKVDDQAGDIH